MTPVDLHQNFVFAQAIQQQQQQQQQQQLNTEPIKVDAGDGNATGPLTMYLPNNIEIKAGQSVI